MKTTRRNFLLFLFALSCIILWKFVSPLTPKYQQDFQSYTGLTLIAHAGGGLETGTYSNSLEALTHSVESGFKLIEIDILPTQNGDLVLMHDWSERHYKYFSKLPLSRSLSALVFPRPAKTAKAFKSRVMNYGLTQMDLSDLINWMQKNDDVYIVTDIKQNNLENLQMLHGLAGPLSKRIIPQIYQLSSYKSVREMGYENVIYTNYKSHISGDDLISFMTDNSLYALTVPVETVTDKLIKSAQSLNTPIFVHRGSDGTPKDLLNTVEGAESVKLQGISGIYTDYLVPSLD